METTIISTVPFMKWPQRIFWVLEALHLQEEEPAPVEEVRETPEENWIGANENLVIRRNMYGRRNNGSRDAATSK